ncbi:hypothetical protein ILYODFUR_039145 [Ilyodon furcidens]|uniref:Uncharacterized protein n=1 Tax=Ilyodon furcidens TaxID=33524 RepID=A0ABV0UC16_9TELE
MLCLSFYCACKSQPTSTTTTSTTTMATAEPKNRILIKPTTTDYVSCLLRNPSQIKANQSRYYRPALNAQTGLFLKPQPLT